MTHRVLKEALRAYHIGDAHGAFPVYSPDGAAGVSGRWHRAGDRVIYSAEHYATAMREKLVHWSGEMPGRQHFVEITIPAGTSYEVLNPDMLPDWRSSETTAAQDFGHEGCAERRSAVLLVPSAIAPIERNILINADHPEFGRLRCGLETPIWWDDRLFRQS